MGSALTPPEKEIERLRRRVAELEGVCDELKTLSAILEGSPDYVCRVGRDRAIQYMNRVALGYDIAEVLGQPFTRFIDEDHRAVAAQAVDETFATGEPTTFEVVVSDPSGAPMHFATRVAPIFGADGEVDAVVLLARDVSVLRNLIDTLRARESQLRVAIEATGFGLWSYEVQPGHIAWHREASEVFGVSPDQAPRTLRELWPLIVAEDRQRVDALVAQVVRSGKPAELEFRARRPDGTIRWLFSRVAVENDHEGKPVRVFGGVIDITEPRQIEEQLRQAQKMDAIGQLATGIAHNFNNLLTAIAANVAMLRRRTSSDSLELVESVNAAATRGADLVRQLMLFSRAESGPMQEGIDVAAVLRETVSMCGATFESRFQIAAQIPETLPEIRGDATQLLQVFLNICLNGRDAMDTTDTRILSIEAETRAGSDIEPPPVEPGDAPLAPRYLCVRIRDTGCGMDQTTASRVFEPFFTTKDLGRGTGLGLSTSFAIVRHHGGWLRCDSLPGEGTTFTVYLPVR